MPKVKVDGVEIDVPAGRHRAAGVRAGGERNSPFLLSRAAEHRGQLPDVPRRGEAGAAQTAGVLRAAGRRQSGDFHQHTDGEARARGDDGVPPHQPSARLPDLRPGRRMRFAGPVDRLRPRAFALRREQACGHREIYGADRQDGNDAVHPVHALHPFRRGGRGGRGDRRDRIVARICRSPAISKRR